MTLSRDAETRQQEFKRLSQFMAWKLSPGFTMAAEFTNPDAVFCFGSTHWEQAAVYSRVLSREPLRSGHPSVASRGSYR